MKASEEQQKIIDQLKKRYQLKGITTFRGMDQQGFNSHLYCDGKPLCYVDDSGDGGEMNYSDWNVRQRLNEELKDVGKIDYDGFNLEYDADLFILDLLQEALLEQTHKRKSKKNTLYRLKENKENQYMMINRQYTPEIKKHLEAKHGDNLLEIINERYVK